jgi:hypothetical protein
MIAMRAKSTNSLQTKDSALSKWMVILKQNRLHVNTIVQFLMVCRCWSGSLILLRCGFSKAKIFAGCSKFSVH